MSTVNHLRPVFGSAFNAAILQEIANDLNTPEDTQRAQNAHERFHTICDSIVEPPAKELRDELNEAITNADIPKLLVMSDAYDIDDHPIVANIKKLNAEILPLQQQLDELNSRRAAYINEARAKGISNERIADIAHAVE